MEKDEFDRELEKYLLEAGEDILGMCIDMNTLSLKELGVMPDLLTISNKDFDQLFKNYEMIVSRKKMTFEDVKQKGILFNPDFEKKYSEIPMILKLEVIKDVLKYKDIFLEKGDFVPEFRMSNDRVLEAKAKDTSEREIRNVLGGVSVFEGKNSILYGSDFGKEREK